MMKLNQRYIFLPVACLLLAFVASCTCESEMTPEVDYRNPSSYFMPADDDTSQTANIRREFYAKNGIYLLFNDTLQNEYQGTDINGDSTYFTETIDIGYNVGQTSNSSTTYQYSYLKEVTDQQKAVDFVNDYLLTHLTGKLKPYSIFICKAMVGTNSNTGSTLRPYAMMNQRCMVVSTNYLMTQQRTEAQKQKLAQTMLNAVIGQIANNNSTAFSTFYSYSSQYYSANCSDYNMTGTLAECQSVGFLSAASTGSFPNQTTDLSAYVTQAIQMTEEQFNKKYAGKDVCIAKFAEVKKVLSELGYVY